MNQSSRPPWLIPVLIGVVVGLVVIGGVALGLSLSRGGFKSSVASATDSSTTQVTVTETSPAQRETPDDSDDVGSEPDSEDSQSPESVSPDQDSAEPELPVPPVSETTWYAQFGAFLDYDNAVQVRDQHYGSLILPGEMVGSSSRYVVARPAASRSDAEYVCAQFDTGACVVREVVGAR